MAQTDRDVFDKAGQYNLTELAIISYRTAEDSLPRRIDITGILYNFEIAEDIFTSNLVGSVIVYDMQDIRTILPITGLERLSLRFNSPGTPGYDCSEDTGVPLQIYKVDKVRKDPTNERAQLYQIFFCSPEMYRNTTTRISKAYTGNVEVAVQDIVKNYLKSNKPLIAEATRVATKVVIPNLRPYDAISMLCGMALPKNFEGNAGYVFYETSQAFYFRSLASMMGHAGMKYETPPRWKYSALIGAVTEHEDKPEIQDIERRLSNVIKYEFDKPVDMLENINNGFYANRVVTHDAFNKTITTTDFNYNKDAKLQPHTDMSRDRFDNVGLLYPEQNDGSGVEYADTGKSLSEMPESKLMVASDTSKVHDDYEFTPTKGTLNLITNQEATVRNMNLSMLVYGNTLINAGDIVTFTSPVMRPSEAQPENSPYTSGRYCIMAIKHMVNVEAQRHEMVLKCFKDSVRIAYPKEEDALSSIGKGQFISSDLYTVQKESMA